MTAKKVNYKTKRIDLEEQLKCRMLEKAGQILEASGSEYWMTNYVNTLDRYRDGTGNAYPLSQPTDRRYGSNFPFWTSESELNLIRASSRLTVAMNPSAYGLLNGITSYVIGTGFAYRVVARDESGLDEKWVERGQRAIDTFMHENAWCEMEQELFSRSREDGDAFLRLFPQQSGGLQVRTIEPEQLTQPPDSTFAEWSYGIQTDLDDVFSIKAYHVHYLAPKGGSAEDQSAVAALGDIVPADQIVHIKCNVRRSIKRGLPDFSFDTQETLSQAGKLRRNLGEGAAVQAAIAAIRQHDTSTAGQVETFIQQAIDYSASVTGSGKQADFQRLDAGSFLDIPKGMNYLAPPGANNSGGHLEIFQMLLRSAGNRHNAPEWLCSGDASNNNYASSLTAESPFLRNCLRLQSVYARSFKRVITAAVQNEIDAGNLPENFLKLVDIVCTPPSVETRNKSEEASANQTYISLGVKSPQTVAQELGMKWETEQANIEDYHEQMGAKPGEPLPDGPLPGGNDEEEPEPDAVEQVVKPRRPKLNFPLFGKKLVKPKPIA